MGKYVPKNFSNLKKKKFLAFSGIGNPHTFFDTLKSLKIKLVDYKRFPDHYNYTDGDLQKLRELAKINGCKLITTEKDYVKIKDKKNEINVLSIESNLEKTDEKKFKMFLEEKLNA